MGALRMTPLAALVLVACCAVAGGTAASGTASGRASSPWLDSTLAFAAGRISATMKSFPAGDPNQPDEWRFPSRTTSKADGQWTQVKNTDWVAGFYPGWLWQLHFLTGRPEWAAAATALLPGLKPVENYIGSHDIGFIMMSSFGNALRAAPPGSAQAAHYRKVLLTAAGSLAKRYAPKLGYIRSWRGVEQDKFEVIIDNVMNLELLWTASRLAGGNLTAQREWRAMATSHARNTARDFFRPDGSTFHKLIWSLSTGQLVSKGTHQGYSDSSTWTRGQAWALHGFTLAYLATGDAQFKATAERAADLFLRRLSPDWVPVYDFDAPPSEAWKDTSAGAIAAGGLLRLSRWTGPPRAQQYRSAALSILRALAGGYLSSSSARAPQPASILRNGTASRTDYGTGTSYGDYYLLEALAACKTMLLC